MAFARVAVPVPLGRAFTYAVPAELAPRIVRGARVLCDFGRRRILGVVVELRADAADVAADKLKPIRAVVDDVPVLPLELLEFLLELARYYIAPIGEVMRLALPAVERDAAESLESQGMLPSGSLPSVGRLMRFAVAVTPFEETPELDDGARAVLDRLRQTGAEPIAELARTWKKARGALRRLEQLGLVTFERRARLPQDPFFAEAPAVEQRPELTPAQLGAVRALHDQLERGEGKAYLLEGVTGSGKTEVYLRAVERCLALGRSAILLVPEIALTPQLVLRVRSRIGDDIAVLHSGLGARERHVMWRRLRSGELKVAVGARSALFAPVQKLGLVCVDEEHDSSFKQEEGVRYNARDMALLRAHRAGAICVLGSATPSLESEMLVRQAKAERLVLPERARATATLPEVQIVDLRRIKAGAGTDRLLTLPLYRALEGVLEARQQAILFLNRRGFAPSLICEQCGTISQCPSCSVALTLHKGRAERTRCHYCDYEGPPAPRCAECGEASFAQEGAGTERVEEALKALFPKARVARLDRDVGSGRAVERVLERVRRGDVDILVGTQMVTKGHDLPNVTLVGVLNADAALSMPDFRAAERTFQLLVQVAGRAGRGAEKGSVIVQTRSPDAHAIAYAVRHDVRGFIERELIEREELGYPPFSRIALIKLDALDETKVEAEASRIAQIARRAAKQHVAVLGPAAAPLARLRNRYRYRVLLRSAERAALRECVLAVARATQTGAVRVVIDVDPVNML